MMNNRIACLALASSLSWCLSACDGSTETAVSPGGGGSGRIAHILDVSGRLDQSRAGTASVRVVVAGKTVVPDAQGAYRILDTVYADGASRVRSSEAGPEDTVRIIVGADTVRKIPITTWSAVLPTNYIVQRNVGVEVAAKHAGLKLEAVWWSNDSIANTVVLGQGTSSRKYSGYIYNVYDDAMFGSDAHLYWLFVRITSTSTTNAATTAGIDSVIAYTNVTDVTAKDGDQTWDSTQFETNTRIKTLGYTLVPDDSSVAVYAKTKTVVMVLDSVVKLDTVAATATEFTWSDESGVLANFDGSVDSGSFVDVRGIRRLAPASFGEDTLDYRFTIASIRVSFVAQDTGKWSLGSSLDYRPLTVAKGLNDTTFATSGGVGQPSSRFLANTDVTGLKFVFVVMEKIKFYRR